MRKLKDKKIYTANTFNMNYIGKFNEDTNELENVYGITFARDERDPNHVNIELTPAIHPAFLVKKFDNTKLNPVDFPVSIFIQFEDPDEIEIGENLVNQYLRLTTGIIVDASEEEKKEGGKGMSNDEIAERLKKAVDNNGKKNDSKIIH